MAERHTGTVTRWGAIAAAYAALVAMGLADNARGPAFPAILDHFRLSSTAGSLMFAAASVGSVAVAWTGRVWLVRLGPVVAARIFAALLAAACLGMGAAGLLDAGLPGLVAASLVFGLGATGMSVSANALVGAAAAPAQRRRLLSGLHAMYGASSLLAPLALSLGARLGADWRLVFVALAAVPLLAGLLALSTRPLPARRPAAGPLAARPRRSGAAAACAALALTVVAEIALSSRLPQLAEEHWGWDADSAGLVLSGFFAALLAGRLAFALVRLPGPSAVWLALSASSSLAVYVAGLFVHPAILVGCGLTMSIFFPTAIAWIQETFPDDAERMVATAVAVVGASLAAMHFGVGLLTDAVGIRAALLVGPACLVGTLVLLRRMRA